MKNVRKSLCFSILFLTASIKGFSHEIILPGFVERSHLTPFAVRDCMVKSIVGDLRSHSSFNNNRRLVASYNQTEGNFLLNLQCSRFENVTVIIIDAAGKTIHTGYMQVVPGANNISYYVGTLPFGIYYMQVTANDKTVNDKFVVAG